MDNNNSFSQSTGYITCACGKKIKSNAVFCNKCKRISPSLSHTHETHEYLRELSLKNKRISNLFLKISIILIVLAVISSLFVSYGIIPLYSYKTYEREFPDYDQSSKAELGDIYVLDVVSAICAYTNVTTVEGFSGSGSVLGSKEPYKNIEKFYIFFDNDGKTAAFSTSDAEIQSDLEDLSEGRVDSLKLFARVDTPPHFSGAKVQIKIEGNDIQYSSDDSHLSDEEKQGYADAEEFFEQFTNFELDNLPVTKTVRYFGYGSAVLVLAAVSIVCAIALFVISLLKKSYAARLGTYMEIIHRTYSTKTE